MWRFLNYLLRPFGLELVLVTQFDPARNGARNERESFRITRLDDFA